MTPQRERQYTVGASATFQPSARWTHAVIAGLDGYRLAGVSADGLPIPSAADSALRAARGGADRGTLRVSSTARLGAADTRAAVLTLGVEHSSAREVTGTGPGLVAPRGGPGGGDVAPGGTTWWSNTGVLAQAQAAFRNALFLSGGGRVEWIRAPSGDAQAALLPMVGAAYAREWGPVTLKLRTAYGRGIRPARTVARGGTWMGNPAAGALTTLGPEQQSGIETGLDVLMGSRFGVHVTRFDQRASGLVQPVLVAADTLTRSIIRPLMSSGPGRRRVAYELQNVGAILNRGWEMQASTGAGPLSLVGSLALVSSRVDQLASGYRGDLRPGDRILEVPARTASLTASWTATRFTASWSAARASDWINYDRVALVQDLTDGTRTPRDLLGSQLRAYWREYRGVTRMRATTSVRVWHATSLTLTGENLLDRQRGEPDNVTVLPGRTLSVGARTAF